MCWRNTGARAADLAVQRRLHAGREARGEARDGERASAEPCGPPGAEHAGSPGRGRPRAGRARGACPVRQCGVDRGAGAGAVRGPRGPRECEGALPGGGGRSGRGSAAAAAAHARRCSGRGRAPWGSSVCVCACDACSVKDRRVGMRCADRTITHEHEKDQNVYNGELCSETKGWR